ncbi:class II fructose-bisphosphate aldolase [Ferviditalea candida]|uniref:Class II fructose-bisphosphate aldolase n=1 Tax=Ferviditalea candida TaxID=3108399 RepID=A0ABU5ZCS7_9BACL|nr:class II fructose-bisphosphate aldolase [Paenibacillaceae bacterium T2]
MLGSTKEILLEAQQNNYAVAAFNVFNMETAQAAVLAAENRQMPVILALGERYLDTTRIEAFSAMVHTLAAAVSVPVALHLDHAYELESIRKAIRCGFTSVMYDGSKFSLEENIRHTKEVVKLAHRAAVSVEAEIGSTARGDFSDEEEGDGRLTDPQEAGIFVQETCVDFLAAAIGTVHGMYKGEPRIDLGRLEALHRTLDIPLVLHGGSGTPDSIIRESIRSGIRKINVNTEVSMTAVKQLTNFLNEHSAPHLSRVMADMQQSMATVMERFIDLFANRSGSE